VFWVDVLDRSSDRVVIRNRSDSGRHVWPQVTAEIEPDLLRPLVRGRDVGPFRASPSHWIVMPHLLSGKPVSLEEMHARWPLTFRYFETFREAMLRRAHYRQHFARLEYPYWSMYNVGAYTFARHRAVWREQSRTLQCAAIDDEDWIADAKLTVVPCHSDAEAHYLAATLNSQPAREFVEAYAVRIQISTHVLRNLRVPQFDESNGIHCELAALGRSATQERRGSADSLARIDALPRELWRLA
jgi:hypothetical protein